MASTNNTAPPPKREPLTDITDEMSANIKVVGDLLDAASMLPPSQVQSAISAAAQRVADVEAINQRLIAYQQCPIGLEELALDSDPLPESADTALSAVDAVSLGLSCLKDAHMILRGILALATPDTPLHGLAAVGDSLTERNCEIVYSQLLEHEENLRKFQTQETGGVQ